MSYRINISRHGRFHFEVNRIGDELSLKLSEFVGKLRDDYPEKEGYKVTAYEVRTTSRSMDI